MNNIEEPELNLLILDKDLTSCIIRLTIKERQEFIEKFKVQDTASKNKGKREAHKKINEFLEYIKERGN